MEKEAKITYTTILQKTRKRLGISMTEYAIADYVFKVGGGEKSREIGGWVYASRPTIAENIGVSRITVIRGINKLIEKGLIEKHPKTKNLRSTNRWYVEVVLEKMKIKPK